MTHYTFLYAESLDVVGAVSSAREVCQVELDLVPTVVEPHRHRAYEGLHLRNVHIKCVRNHDFARGLPIIRHIRLGCA